MEISLLVALKNNLEYTKYFYQTTREIYPNVEICFASYGSTDGTNTWLSGLSDKNVKVFMGNSEATFSDTYNQALKLSTKDYVVYVHNDIVLAPNFIENILKHTNESTIVSYTTVEPPIFAGHSRPGKIIKDFGTDLETFKNEEFLLDTKQTGIFYKDRTEPGAVFFMCMPRKVLLEMGGLDNLFNPCFCEDDDLILRFKLKGLNMITSLDAICYHFVSKTSRFSEDAKKKTTLWEYHSNRNFIRKWGFRDSIYKKKYKIGYFPKGECSYEILNSIEPWCSNIYITDSRMKRKYIDNEQQNTKIKLDNKINPISEHLADICVEFDCIQLTAVSISLLRQLPDIIYEAGDKGKFSLDIFNIYVYSLDSYEHLLINKTLF